ncbi:MAG: hypothetical protein ACYS67_07785 [Planctomycetota bacterium]|jgi:hypothetical protein
MQHELFLNHVNGKSKLKILSGIIAALLLWVFACPLQAEDEAGGRAELVRACEEKVKRVEQGMQRWASQGHHPFEIRDIMHAECFPLMRSGRFREAEQVLDRVLDILKKGPPVPKPKNLKKYLRQTKETQYLILPVREAGHLYGGQTRALEKAIERTVERIGKAEDVKKRNWGFHLIIPAWRFDPKHSENKHADIARAVRCAFDVALHNDVAVHLTVESHEWNNRPDLWNYGDKDKPGYNPKNKTNVEWVDWEGTPHPHRYRDWGIAERMAPVICYNSPTVLREVSRLIGEVVAPPIKAGLERLSREGKDHLFSGLTVGAEPALPNYENIDRHNPRIARMMDQDGSPKVRLGYNALTNNGYSKSNPPRDFPRALAKVNQDYTTYWCRKLAQAGIPTEKMYTHVAAGAGVIGSPGVEFTNAPIEIAFNDFSRPGWTTYPIGPLQPDFEHLYKALAEHGNPYWASTEGGPSLGSPGGKHALSMKDYLARHFDYGATVIVFNTGATSKELSKSLTEGVWGADAVNAYRVFLNPGK